MMKCGYCGKTGEAEEITAFCKYRCLACKQINEVTNIPIRQWIGFNYLEFIRQIEKFISKDNYEALKVNTEIEKIAGYFTSQEIDALKSVLIEGFNKGLSIREIRNELQSKIDIRDLLKTDDNGNIVKDENGNPKVQLSADKRALMIARTETTRAAAEGSLLNYKENSIQRVRFLSALSQRTCDMCAGNNGKVFTVEEARDIIPYGTHPLCRCSWLPVQE